MHKQTSFHEDISRITTVYSNDSCKVLFFFDVKQRIEKITYASDPYTLNIPFDKEMTEPVHEETDSESVTAEPAK